MALLKLMRYHGARSRDRPASANGDPATTDIPILIVTGHPLTDEEKTRLNEHALAVLAKGDAALSGLLGWLDQVGGRQR